MARVLLMAFAAMFILVVALCGTDVLAQTHHVFGGDDGWSSELAGRVFRVGDKIWFRYSAAGDTIAELRSLEEFISCDITNPIRMYSDGLNDVTLEKEGTRYFTSGNIENCKNGMKLHVPVEPAPPTQPEPEPFSPILPEPPTQPEPEPLPPIKPEPPTQPKPLPPIKPEPPTQPKPLPPIEPAPLVPTPPEPVPIHPPPATPPPPPSAATSTPSNALSFLYYGLLLSYFVL